MASACSRIAQRASSFSSIKSTIKSILRSSSFSNSATNTATTTSPLNRSILTRHIVNWSLREQSLLTYCLITKFYAKPIPVPRITFRASVDSQRKCASEL